MLLRWKRRRRRECRAAGSLRVPGAGQALQEQRMSTGPYSPFSRSLTGCCSWRAEACGEKAVLVPAELQGYTLRFDITLGFTCFPLRYTTIQ